MASSTSFPIPSSSTEMPQELAKHLFDTGATIVFVDFPEGAEFGVDYKSWVVGAKFKGLKMIPPGVHFIYYSVGKMPRIGFFHRFVEKELMVKRWDRKTEDLSTVDVDANEAANIGSNLRSLDRCLGVYPFETYKSWFALSSHITGQLVEQLRPLNGGRITAQAELVTMENEMAEGSTTQVAKTANIVDRQHPNRIRFSDEQGLPVMRIRPGYELRFHDIPVQKIERDVSKRTERALDHSDQLLELIAQMDNETDLLGEMQFAFVCFLMGQIYEAFEHWKRLVHLVCSCKSALVTHHQLFVDFLMTLHFQLKECPRDFFVDIVSRSNFLTITLANLFSNIDCEQNADTALKQKARKFKNYLTKQFKWDFDTEEDSPTIVE